MLAPVGGHCDVVILVLEVANSVSISGYGEHPIYMLHQVQSSWSLLVLLQAGDSGAAASKDAGAVGRATSDFSLDDLLGLGPDPAPSETVEPPTPSSDPFQVPLVAQRRLLSHDCQQCLAVSV